MPSELLSREPVLDEKAFWGRQHDVRWLADKLGGYTPQNCNLIGEPRIGKTSLLYHVYQQKIGLPVHMVGLYVWVRLVELAAQDSNEFWRLMLTQLHVAMGGRAGTSTNALPDNERDIFDVLDMEIDSILSDMAVERIVFLIDDFDLLVGGVSKHDLDWLRALATRYGESLSFVISSTEPLVKLCDKIVEESGVSPFPNLFHSYWLGLLEKDGAERLCLRAAEVRELTLMPESLSFLLAEAGRHPDLLKVACEHFFDVCGETAVIPCYDLARTEFRLDAHVNWLCRQLWQRRSEKERGALAELAAGNTHIADPILAAQLTRRLGLVEENAGGLRLFAGVFRYWIAQETAVFTSPVFEQPISEFDHDSEHRFVIIDERQIHLTKLENRLLAYLLAHTNEICSVEALLENVWDASKQISVVEKGINRLRTKIEIDPRRPRYILSARGEGYILRTN
ncbi:MAG: winged helix-turn-helix transcriptional regulator [Anaerolineae bacterium]|nr:winged helix-turn-helix transcriptional regulator [Anaerolineae bacterium]